MQVRRSPAYFRSIVLICLCFIGSLVNNPSSALIEYSPENISKLRLPAQAEKLDANNSECSLNLLNPEQTPQEAVLIPMERPEENTHLSSQGARFNIVKFPAGLAVAGLLIMPFDRSLFNAMPHDQGHRSSFTSVTNSFGTPTVLLPAIGGLYLLGDQDDKKSAKMALSALINAGVAVQGLKMLAGRERPTVTGGEGEMRGPSIAGGNNSFPSGHTAAAFAVATVMAHRYPKRKWIYYGLAAAVGFARINESEHYPADVLVGAGIGMLSGNCALQYKQGLLSFCLK